MAIHNTKATKELKFASSHIIRNCVYIDDYLVNMLIKHLFLDQLMYLPQ